MTGTPPPEQPYGAPQYAVGYAPPTNTMAIIALIGAFLVPIVGIICGRIALSQIKRTGETGRGLALAGVIIGYVYTILLLIIIIVSVALPFVFLALLGSASTYS